MEKPNIRQIRDLSTPDIERLIGALLETHKVLSKMNYNPDAKEINRLHHGVKFALKKAGCKLE